VRELRRHLRLLISSGFEGIVSAVKRSPSGVHIGTGSCFRTEWTTKGAGKRPIVFYQIPANAMRTLACLSGDVIMSLILFAAQLVITLLAFVSELHEDPRFADEKLIYRS
jgi:hypothetical protein